MPTYRLYQLSVSNRIFAGVWIEAPDDEAAMAIARSMCEPAIPVVEVWRGTRCLGRVSCTKE